MVKIGNIELSDFPLLLAPMEDVSDPPRWRERPARVLRNSNQTILKLEWFFYF